MDLPIPSQSDFPDPRDEKIASLERDLGSLRELVQELVSSVSSLQHQLEDAEKPAIHEISFIADAVVKGPPSYAFRVPGGLVGVVLGSTLRGPSGIRPHTKLTVGRLPQRFCPSEDLFIDRSRGGGGGVTLCSNGSIVYDAGNFKFEAVGSMVPVLYHRRRQ